MGRWFRRCASLAVPALALVSCGGAAHGPVPTAPVPLQDEDVRLVATLLELEDARVYDAEVFAAAASSTVGSVRGRAALALARIGSAQGQGVVRGLLSDPDTSVAAQAAFAAGLLADSASVPTLAALLHPDSARRKPTVASEAAAALGRIGTGEAQSAVTDFLLAVQPAEERVAPAVEEALIAAWRAGLDEWEPLARWARSDHAGIRWRLAYGLARTPGPDAVALLLPILGDPEPLVRANAARGAVSSLVSAAGEPTAPVITRLVELTADSAYAVRVEAIRSLGTYASAESVAALQQVLASGGPHEVVAAGETLGRMGNDATAALGSLRRLVVDPSNHPHIRATALEAALAIDRGGTRDLLTTVSEDPAWRVRSVVVSALARDRIEAIPALEIFTRDRDPRIAAAALEAIVISLGPGEIGQARSLLLEMVQSPDVQVRVDALQGLAWLADPATYPALLDAFDAARSDEDPEAAIAAVDAIADLGLANTMAPERAFFARFDRPTNREIHRRAVVRFGDPAVAAWGEVPPPQPATRRFDYQELVEEWIRPPPAEQVPPRVRIVTDAGTIEVRLLPHEAPMTVANFLQLTRERFFDGQEWPRLVPNFMLQGGDPVGDTTGGPGYSIRDEPGRRRFGTGSVGMALSGRDTAGSQFFLTHSPQPHLDGEFTVFAQVIEGQDVLQRLLPGDRILTVREIMESVD